MADPRAAQHHPTAALLLVAEHGAVGDEGLVAEFEEFRDDAFRGRDFGVATDLGAEQPEPESDVDRGIQPVKHLQGSIQHRRQQPLPEILSAGEREASGELAGHAFAQEAGKDARDDEEDGRGGHREQEEHREGFPPGPLRFKEVEPVRVDVVDRDEAREDRQVEEDGDGRGADGEGEHAAIPDQQSGTWRRRRQRGIRLDGTRGGAGPGLAGGYALGFGQRGLAREPRAVAHGGVVLHHGVGVDRGVPADGDATEEEAAALDARVLEVDECTKAGAVADGQEFGHRDRDGVDHASAADTRAEEAQVQRLPWGAGNQVDGGDLVQARPEPPAEIGDTPKRVVAWLESSDQRAPQGDAYRERKGERQQVCAHGDEDRQSHAVLVVTGQEVIGEERRQPLEHVEQHQERQTGGLRQTAPETSGSRRRIVDARSRG